MAGGEFLAFVITCGLVLWWLGGVSVVGWVLFNLMIMQRQAHLVTTAAAAVCVCVCARSGFSSPVFIALHYLSQEVMFSMGGACLVGKSMLVVCMSEDCGWSKGSLSVCWSNVDVSTRGEGRWRKFHQWGDWMCCVVHMIGVERAWEPVFHWTTRKLSRQRERERGHCHVN